MHCRSRSAWLLAALWNDTEIEVLAVKIRFSTFNDFIAGSPKWEVCDRLASTYLDRRRLHSQFAILADRVVGEKKFQSIDRLDSPPSANELEPLLAS